MVPGVRKDKGTVATRFATVSTEVNPVLHTYGELEDLTRVTIRSVNPDAAASMAASPTNFASSLSLLEIFSTKLLCMVPGYSWRTRVFKAFDNILVKCLPGLS